MKAKDSTLPMKRLLEIDGAAQMIHDTFVEEIVPGGKCVSCDGSGCPTCVGTGWRLLTVAAVDDDGTG